MKSIEARNRNLLRKYSYLIGNELTYRGNVYSVTRLWVRKNGLVPCVALALKDNNDSKNLIVDFQTFYKEWTGATLIHRAA